MKKCIFLKMLSLGLICFLTVMTVVSEDFSNHDEWYKLCAGNTTLTEGQKQSCRAFLNQLSTETSPLSQRLQEIEKQKSEIAKNIDYYASQIAEYQRQADSLNGEIATLNGKIGDLNGKIAVAEKQISEKQAKIQVNEKEIEAASGKIKNRMVIKQATMRLNQYLDILMGAGTFDNFIRISNGLSDITDYDIDLMEGFATKIKQLNQDKLDLEKERADLNASKEEISAAKEKVVEKQNEKLLLKYQAQLIQQEYQKKIAELEATGNKIASDIEAIRTQMNKISGKLNEVVASAGWTYPVPGAVISAGTWQYAGGGTHLGEDFAARKGTPVLAVGNGVILHSVNGCGDGYLGNSCGASFGGSTGGGNQVYLLTKINGSLYAIKYLHLLIDTPIAKGTIVSAGMQIGSVGQSGNALGAHCHIEVFYLGSADNFTSYAQNWDGRLDFGAGWGSAALQNTNGGIPSRIRPESVFGG